MREKWVSKFLIAGIAGVSMGLATHLTVAQDVVKFTNIPSGTEAAFPVTRGTELPLPFTTPKGSTVEIYVTPFLGEGGDLLSVQPSIAELPDTSSKGQRISFKTERDNYTLVLKVPAIPAPGKYTGSVIVSQQGKEPQTSRLVLARGSAQRPAKIVVEPKAATLYQVVGNSESFHLTLRNATEWPAEGVFLRLVETAAPALANIDPTKDVTWTWNGKVVDDLWRSPEQTATRAIGPNQQVDFGGTLGDLSPGEYMVKVGVGAANAPVDADQQVTLKFFVKHGWVGPFATLFVAILISYLATKGLEAQRRRGAQLRKVDEIRPSWLRDEPPTLPVIATLAMLKQVENRNQSWRAALVGQVATTAVIAKAEQMLKILGRVRTIRSRIEKSDWESMIRYRANKRLDGIVSSINPDAMDEVTAKQVDADLALIEKWLDPTQRTDSYRQDFYAAMDNLAAQVRPAAFTEAAMVQALHDEISKNRPAAPTDQDLIRLGEAYGKLKVLWERQQNADDPALAELFALLKSKNSVSLEEFFRKADDLAWAHLETSGYRFTAPDNNQVNALGAYQLIQFRIEPMDPKLGNNYLFKHNLDYEWSLALRTEKGEPIPLAQPRTREPRLVQFIPQQGTLYVSVTLRNGTRTSKRADSEPLTIGRSGDFGWLSAFRANDLTALVIALLFALASGFATFYAGKPVFGTLGDYIALFLWGAGVDQAKNFLQNLEKVSPPI